MITTDPTIDSQVKKRMQAMFYGWSMELKDEKGYQKLAKLYQQMPQRARRVRTDVSHAPRAQPKYLSNDPNDLESDEENDEDDSDNNGRRGGPSSGRSRSRGNDYDRYADDDDDNDRVVSSSARVRGAASGGSPSLTTSSSSKPSKSNKKSSSQPQPPVVLSLAKERPKIKGVLAESGSAATNLTNALKLINRLDELSTENKRATTCFNQCRSLRRQVLRYIHSLDSEEYIGPLIHANEELVTALQLYDEMSRPPSDSDSEYDDWKVDSRDNQQQPHQQHNRSRSGASTPTNNASYHPSLSSPIDSPSRRRAPPPPPAKPANLRSPVASPSTRAPPAAQPAAMSEDEEDPFGDSHAADSAPKHTPMW
ncbi:Lsb5p [Sugiyamaella lignohabitans]|uniref:Lsb5p n=1 Tax=Sugiyamaella lignohabitans TaxID=796027 RepID=A0A161HY86_9ASCO|nr:Lsb5p [Sugiyamaella lignohabitans]ANB15046.1 Lsb5p [Sugiyamaella lignohabitans]